MIQATKNGSGISQRPARDLLVIGSQASFALDDEITVAPCSTDRTYHGLLPLPKSRRNTNMTATYMTSWNSSPRFRRDAGIVDTGANSKLDVRN